MHRRDPFFAINPPRHRGQARSRFLALIATLLWAGLLGSLLGAALVSPACAAQETQPSAAPSRTLYTCSMHPQVIRDEPGPCPICGMALTPISATRAGTAAAPRGERKVKYWWDPMMNPPYISDRPGKSPMGMDLIPVYEDDVVAGEAIVIDPRLQQSMGIRTAVVQRGPLRKTVRAFAQVREPEGSRRDVTLRVSGWIERLYADTEGMAVPRGAPLFELFSPELQSAIEEWIAIHRARGSTEQQREIVAAARQKLQQLGLEDDQIERFAHLERAPRTVLFSSPADLHVVEKRVFTGSYVAAGDLLLRLGDRRRIWVDARIYEQDFPYVHEEAEAEAEFVTLPGTVLQGTVSFVHPHVEGQSRTGTARVVLDNPGHQLRDGMYATVRIRSEIAPDALLLPREAVIDSGVRRIVFVDLGDGHFEPREVQLGEAAEGGTVAVRSGLAPGERVVVSGQFLLDVESRLREVARKFGPAGAAGAAEGGAAHGAHHH